MNRRFLVPGFVYNKTAGLTFVGLMQRQGVCERKRLYLNRSNY
jgi:hypothetical protein